MAKLQTLRELCLQTVLDEKAHFSDEECAEQMQNLRKHY